MITATLTLYDPPLHLSRRMKLELQELRRKGAKSATRQYGERTCARCQRPLGKLWNSGAVCRGCSHRICNRCRVGVSAAEWQCTVCHAYRCSSNVKMMKAHRTVRGNIEVNSGECCSDFHFSNLLLVKKCNRSSHVRV